MSIELGLDIQCRAGTQRQADIMLVLDRSSSMSGLKLDAARAAASRFVSQLRPVAPPRRPGLLLRPGLSGPTSDGRRRPCAPS
ncbi:MAG: VWA domain-containing protein [Ardenticatenia bacterium]|nr:VWA domain-containing protein [Ardenticatenia bacterium]